MTVTFPGMPSPAAGFDEPFEMLAGCHERVQRTLDLLGRLVDHLQQHGTDAAAQSAARDVLRYFDIAAPQHHLDEERHLVPLLQASGDKRLQAAAERLLADHRLIEQSWAALRPLLQALQAGAATQGTALDALATEAQHFIDLHGPHILLEDGLAFPQARLRITPEQTAAMSADMAARRGVHRA
jgi:hemerythrin-like domain-containing protein